MLARSMTFVLLLAGSLKLQINISINSCTNYCGDQHLYSYDYSTTMIKGISTTNLKRVRGQNSTRAVRIQSSEFNNYI